MHCFSLLLEHNQNFFKVDFKFVLQAPVVQSSFVLLQSTTLAQGFLFNHMHSSCVHIMDTYDSEHASQQNIIIHIHVHALVLLLSLCSSRHCFCMNQAPQKYHTDLSIFAAKMSLNFSVIAVAWRKAPH
jgi:hypothetical protein